MDFSKKIVLFFLLITIYFHLSYGTTTDYKVGDSNGWTNTFNFTSWSSSKSFHAGDVIWFEYNKEYDNVVRVTHKHFKSCKSNQPIGKIYNSGNDSFTLKSPGHYYFICGMNNHCKDGQKVDIRVTRDGVQPPTISPYVYSVAPAPAPANSTSGGLRYMSNLGFSVFLLVSISVGIWM